MQCHPIITVILAHLKYTYHLYQAPHSALLFQYILPWLDMDLSQVHRCPKKPHVIYLPVTNCVSGRMRTIIDLSTTSTVRKHTRNSKPKSNTSPSKVMSPLNLHTCRQLLPAGSSMIKFTPNVSPEITSLNLSHRLAILLCCSGMALSPPVNTKLVLLSYKTKLILRYCYLNNRVKCVIYSICGLSHKTRMH